MKQKLVIGTTAIIRGDNHRASIGEFYRNYSEISEYFDVHHIISIDQPPKLMEHFCLQETLDLFEEIIPDFVNKHYLISNTPGFLRAYKDIMQKTKELNLINDNDIFWWFEDDWKVNRKLDFFKISQSFLVNNSAFIFSEGAHLGSFRAGPLMSATFLRNYFNLEALKVLNSTCDPEKQYSRWLSGIQRTNGNQIIERKLASNESIQIVFLNIGKSQIKSQAIPMNYYLSSGKFNPAIHFSFHIIQTNEMLNQFEYGIVQPETRKIKLMSIHLPDLIEIFNNDSITYFSLVPSIFEDTGRVFNEKYGLKKWATINDLTTYI